MKIPKEKLPHLGILTLYILLANLIVWWWRPPYLINILLVYLPVTVLNLYWIKNSRRKIIIFALFTVVLFAPPIELVSRLANAWDVQSNLPRLFGTAPLENLIYAFFNFLWPPAFYEFFIDRDTKTPIPKRFRYLILVYLILSVVVYYFYLFFSTPTITIHYWLVGAGLLLPTLLWFRRNPHLLPKIVIPTLFFAGVFLIHEIIALQIGHWWWPGEYLLPLKIMGKTFPLDDVIIWYFLSTPALLGGYEFFVDDDN